MVSTVERRLTKPSGRSYSRNAEVSQGELHLTCGSTEIYRPGPAKEVLTSEMLRDIFGLASRIATDPVSGQPMMIPLGRHSILTDVQEVAAPVSPDHGTDQRNEGLS